MLKKEELEKIRSMGSLCVLELDVTINKVSLDYKDFGIKEDICPSLAEPYGCGYMKFIPFEDVKDGTLEKYNITEQEYREIQAKLDCLSFGYCGWCV